MAWCSARWLVDIDRQEARQRWDGQDQEAPGADHLDPQGTQRTGRVRQWLGTVQAARVWAAPHRLPLTAYDATALALGSRGGGHIRQWPPQVHSEHRAPDWWRPGSTGRRQAPDSRPGPVVWPGGSYAASASSSDSALVRRVLRGAGASGSGASSGASTTSSTWLGRADRPASGT